MTDARVSRLRGVSWAWAASIILVWVAVAARLDQPLGAMQHSSDLVAFGAANGSDFAHSDVWRLHVKFPHMLFNALIIGLVGYAAERRNGRPTTIAVGLSGGALAQLSTVLFHPTAIVSGASQAYLALCGLALLTIKIKSVAWWLALVGVAVAAGLDLAVASEGALKIGHLTGFAAGLLAGLSIRRGGTRGGFVR